MKEKIKGLSNDDLLQVYKMISEHLEYLDIEKKKVEDEENDRGTKQ